MEESMANKTSVSKAYLAESLVQQKQAYHDRAADYETDLCAADR